jgi:transposase-like protein
MYPLAGTIFEKSSTSLRLWFYAMFLITQTRSGVSAKQLQRELGVTYKTAWRMFKQIRMLMAQSSGNLLSGVVEVDETFVGGKGKNRARVWTQGIEKEKKEVVMGMVERGGKAYLKHIPNTGKWTLLTQIQQNVDPKARIITDEWKAYKNLHKFGYLHEAINHSGSEYVRESIYTNNIENVWSHLKRGIYGVYRIVSKKYLQAYVDEYTFRYNNRKSEVPMFDLLLQEVANVSVLKVGRHV